MSKKHTPITDQIEAEKAVEMAADDFENVYLKAVELTAQHYAGMSPAKADQMIRIGRKINQQRIPNSTVGGASQGGPEINVRLKNRSKHTKPEAGMGIGLRAGSEGPVVGRAAAQAYYAQPPLASQQADLHKYAANRKYSGSQSRIPMFQGN